MVLDEAKEVHLDLALVHHQIFRVYTCAGYILGGKIGKGTHEALTHGNNLLYFQRSSLTNVIRQS